VSVYSPTTSLQRTKKLRGKRSFSCVVSGSI
jgi:hypothetical protein